MAHFSSTFMAPADLRHRCCPLFKPLISFSRPFFIVFISVRPGANDPPLNFLFSFWYGQALCATTPRLRISCGVIPWPPSRWAKRGFCAISAALNEHAGGALLRTAPEQELYQQRRRPEARRRINLSYRISR